MAQRSIGQEQFGFAGREQTISSFGAFADFSANEAKPERAAFATYRSLLVARNPDRSRFEPVTAQLKSQAVTIKTGTLVDATIIAPISEDDDDARRVEHKGKRAVRGFNAHIGADADKALVEAVSTHPPVSMTAKQALKLCPTIVARCLPTAPIPTLAEV